MPHPDQNLFSWPKSKKAPEFAALCAEAKECVLCTRMERGASVLAPASGSINAPLMFIGEAPGRLGADATGIPFHGDKTGHNFESLLDFVGIGRQDIFVTNAVLCNPKDSRGNNDTPSAQEIKNCAAFLSRQITLVNPLFIATLGAVALRALALIEPHDLELKSAVRTANNWYGRTLIPLYHPGQRAMVHRSFANQRSDYQFLADNLKREGTTPRKVTGRPKQKVAELAEWILSVTDGVSYFALHKIAYLVEYAYFKKTGGRLTNGYFIRQKDGPYCTDLHIQKIANAIPVRIEKKGGELILYSKNPDSLLKQRKALGGGVIADDIQKYASMTNRDLVRAAYSSTPMRNLLRSEEKGVNLYNTPIVFK